MNIEPDRIITSLWILAGIVWAVGALTTKQTVRREHMGTRVLQIGIMAVAFCLVFKERFRPGPLNAFFVQPTPLLEWVGVGLTAVGIGLAILARMMLGGNWSSSVTVKQDHKLIRSGPYAVVRHPIYTGILLAMLGAAMANGRVGALLGVVVAAVGLRMKSLVEEGFMEREFGEQYAEYKRHVKALIPLVW